jgi:hypothetical protein
MTELSSGAITDVRMVCGFCDNPEGDNSPQLSVLRDGAQCVVCLDCWRQAPLWKRQPLFLPPRTKAPRFLHRIYAALMGYFWMPCPLCHESFGGHEWSNHDGIETAPGRGIGICDACANKRAQEAKP